MSPCYVLCQLHYIQHIVLTTGGQQCLPVPCRGVRRHSTSLPIATSYMTASVLHSPPAIKMLMSPNAYVVKYLFRSTVSTGPVLRLHAPGKIGYHESCTRIIWNLIARYGTGRVIKWARYGCCDLDWKRDTETLCIQAGFLRSVEINPGC